MLIHRCTGTKSNCWMLNGDSFHTIQLTVRNMFNLNKSMNRDSLIFKIIILLLSWSSAFATTADYLEKNGELRVRDSLNRITVFKELPQTIVTLDSGILELLFALGVEDRVVGRSRFADFPKEAEKIPVVGGIVDPNLELLVQIDPDVILLGGLSANGELVGRLEQLNFRVVVFELQTFDELAAHTKLIGTILGNRKEAEALVAEWSTSMDALDARAKAAKSSLKTEPKALLLYGLEGLFSAARNTWPDELFTRAGIRNIAQGAVSRWPQLAAEQVVSGKPDFIIVASSTRLSRMQNRLRRSKIVSNPSGLWKALDMDYEKNLHLLPEGLFVVNGPRIIDSYEALVEALEKFITQ